MRFDLHEVAPSRLDGVWWDYEAKQSVGDKPHAEHACFLVVPFIGSRFLVVHSEKMVPYAELNRRGDMTDEQRRKIYAEAMAETVLRGWANMTDAEGKAYEWTQERAAAVFFDRRWIVYAEFVGRAANNTDALLRREEEQAKGN